MQIRAAKYFFCLFIILFSASISSAEREITTDSELQSLRRQITELQQAMKDANDRHSAEIKMLREEIELLKQNQKAAAKESSQQASLIEPNQPPAPIAAYTASTENKESPLGRVSQGLNLDISAIGDFIFRGGQIPKGETPGSLTATNKARAQLREAEFGFSSPVDPYGRADLILSVERQDNGEYKADIEEGYFTFTNLPYDLQAKVGKFYSTFGKANMMHTHAMPWVDRPNVINKFFGDEGLNDGGGEISWLVPNPWDKYIQLSVDIQNNGNDTSFGGTQGDSLMYVTHLKSFFDLNRDSTLELGGSFATGSNTSNSRTNIEGLDLTYKWRNPQQGLYKSVTWMNELLFSQRGQEDGGTVNAKGWYSSLEYQFARRWSVFGRYDYTEFPDNSSLHENSYSAGLTFRQSEFMFWRLQFEHTNGDNYAGNVNRNELLLQADFLIGQHPAHQY